MYPLIHQCIINAVQWMEYLTTFIDLKVTRGLHIGVPYVMVITLTVALIFWKGI